MKKAKIIIAFLLFFSGNAWTLVHAQPHKKTSSAKNTSTNHNPIVGTWRLVEYADLDTLTGIWNYEYGKHPIGYFTYTKSNIVNLNIAADSTLGISEDSARKTNINLLNWVYNYSCGYFGTYSVDYPRGIVTHHVKGGSLPWYRDTDQPRPFILKGDTLIIGDNKTWKRVLVKAD